MSARWWLTADHQRVGRHLGRSAAAGVGDFEAAADVGSPKIAGSAAFNPLSQTYALSAAGTNMWAQRGRVPFRLAEVKGDFILQARVASGKGVDPHRKVGWMVRARWTPIAPYVDGAVHGDGLTSLQFRRTKGAITEQIKFAVRRRRDPARAARRHVHHFRRGVRRAVRDARSSRT